MLLILLGTGLILVPLFHALGMSSVVAFLLGGVILGPSGLNWIQDLEFLSTLSHFGVVMLLFLIGLELSPSKLIQLKRGIFAVGGSQLVLGTLLLSILVAVVMSLSLSLLLIAAFALTLSSTAVGVKILKDLNLLNTEAGQNSLAVAIAQDLAVIPFLALIPALFPVANHTSLTFLDRVLWGGGLILALVLISRYVLPRALHFLARTRQRELLTGFSLMLVLGISTLMEHAGLSAELGAFLAGVLLANSEYRHELEVDIEPFKGLLLGLFFITVGMQLNLAAFSVQVVFFTVALLVVKILVGISLGKIFKMPWADSVIFAVALSQVSEFAFVLFGLLAGAQLMTPDQYQFFALVAGLSMLSTSTLMTLSRYLLRDRKPKEFDSIEQSNPVILAGIGRVGQMVQRVLLARNIPSTVIDLDPNQIQLLNRFGYKTFYGDATRMDLLESAGIAKAKVLVIALDNFEACRKIIEICRTHFPQVKILARCRNRVEAFELVNLGIEPFRETFGTSLELAGQTLQALGMNSIEADATIAAFRSHDLKMLKVSAQHHNDENKLKSIAQAGREELSRILQVTESARKAEEPAEV